MSEPTIGNDGLTDSERKVLADDYAKAAGSMTPEQVRTTIDRIKAKRAKRWDTLNLIDRVQESLNAKIEGDGGHLPTRGMLNLADIQALINLAKETS